MGWLIVASILALPVLVVFLPSPRGTIPSPPHQNRLRVAPILAALYGAPAAAWFAYSVTKSGYNPESAPWPVALLPAASLLALPLLRWRRPLPPLLVAALVALAAAPPLLWNAGDRHGDLSQCGG